MVLEELFRPGMVRHRPYLALVFGFFFTVVAFIISYLLLKSVLSVATVFLTTLLLIPTMIKLLKMEERLESKFGLKNFFMIHKDIFEVYLFSFLGVFIAFAVIGIFLQAGGLFDLQARLVQQDVNAQSIREFVDSVSQPTYAQALSLFAHNLLVVVICFALSFFYGASAIFLIILNGSVFASFIVLVIRVIAENILAGVQAFLFFMIHLLPEISGFMLAAIAGGVVSKAISVEKRNSKAFRNVFKDVTVLMLISMGLVLLGTLLEVFVTARLFQMFF
jgi:uncharacterized membrane protein SpoIIM required for sporulation